MSMLLCIVTPIAVYMAADSRQYPSGADTVEKVFLVGKDGMLAHGGIGVIPNVGSAGRAWDAAEEVRRISGGVPDGSFEVQLRSISQQVQTSFSTAVSRYFGKFAENPHLAIMFRSCSQSVMRRVEHFSRGRILRAPASREPEGLRVPRAVENISSAACFGADAAIREW